MSQPVPALEVIHDWMPVEIIEKADAPDGQRLRFRGIMSTEHEDLQGDTVDQGGMDYAPLLARGWLNDNHSKTTGDELGLITKAEPVTIDKVRATAVEGVLFDTPQNRKIAANARSMRRLGRGYGFSVEGKILQRSGPRGKRVARSIVSQLALTRCPVNTQTKMELLHKSLDTLQKAMTVGYGLATPGATVASLAPVVPFDLEGDNEDHVQFFNGAPFDWDTFRKTWDTGAARDAAGARPGNRTLTKAQAAMHALRRRPDLNIHQLRALLLQAQA